MGPKRTALALAAACLAAAAPSLALSPPGYLWSGDTGAYYDYSELSTAPGGLDTLLEGDSFTVPEGRYRRNYPVSTSPFQVIVGVPSAVTTAGQADAGRLEALAVGRASSNRVASVTSQFANVFTVGAGTSGLQPGDPVTVQMTLRHTGITSVEINPDAGDTASWAEAHAGLEVKDPSQGVDTGEGIVVPTLVDYELSILYQAGHNPYSLDRSYDYDWSWSLDVAGVTVASDGDRVSESVPDNTIQVCSDPSYAYLCLRDRTFDTGTRTFTFETVVEASLEIVGGVDILSQARGDDAIAIGDFARGFTVTLEPVTPGVELTAAIVPLTGNDTGAAEGGTPEVIPVLANDAPDAALHGVGTPGHGAAVANADGTVTYTAEASYAGTDAFTYTAADTNGYTEEARVEVQVAAGNHAPVAADDAATTDEGTAVTVDVLANDTDADGDALSVAGVTQGTHGEAIANADGTVTYTPEPGFSGEDSFTYTVADGSGGTDEGTVRVAVAALPASGADLAVSLTDSPDPVGEGETLTYRITIKNRGPDPATQAVLTDALPATRLGAGPVQSVLAWVELVSAEPSQGTCSEADAAVTCDLGDLDPGAEATVTVVTTVKASGQTLSNSASVTAATADADASNNEATAETTVTARADLSVSAVASPDPAPVGGTLRYDLTVSNAGPNTAAAAWVELQVPAGASFLSAILVSGEDCAEADGVVRCELGDLPSGEQERAVVTVTPPAAADLVAAVRTGSATPDPDAANDAAELTTRARGGTDMALTQSVPPGPLLAGSQWVVELTVANRGEMEVVHPTLTLDLPAGLRLVASGDAACEPEGGAQVCDIPYRFPPGSSATFTFTLGVPATTGPVPWEARIASSLPDPHPENDAVTTTAEVVEATNVWPTGLEVTQGLQDLANDMPLVAGRATSVRVYLQATAHVTGVRARLRAFRNGEELADSPLESQDPTAQACTDGGRRTHVEDGFWFWVPPSWRTGTVTFVAEVNPDRTLVETDYEDNTSEVSVTFHPGQPLNVMMVPLHIDPSGANLAGASYRVSDRSFPKIVRGLMRYHPLAELNLWTFQSPLYPEFHLFGSEWDLTRKGDGDSMLARIWWKNFWTADVAENLHYVGMVGPRVRIGDAAGLGFAPGDESWALMKTVCFRSDGSWYDCSPGWMVRGGQIMAHELGHNLGLLHMRCDGTEDDGGAVDEAYPWPYPACQLADVDPAGYYGFDVYYDASADDPKPAVLSNDPQAPGGHRAFPLMGYAYPAWVSPYEYCALLQSYGVPCERSSLYRSLGTSLFSSEPVSRTSGREAAAPGPRALALLAAQRYVALSGVVDPSTGTAEIRNVYQVDDPLPDAVARAAELADLAPDSTYTLTQLGAGGELIDSQALPVHGEGPVDGVRAFALLVPLADGAQALEVRDGDAVLARREASAAPPTVQILAPNGGETLEDGAVVQWEASDPDGDPLSFTVLYSPDQGESWREVAMGVEGDQLALPSLADLPGSERGLFRVVANDGFLTAEDDSDGPLTVPGSAPEAFILQPAEGDAVPAGAPVLLQGMATDPDEGPVGDGELTWISDRDGELGSGRELQARSLSQGVHRITLKAVDASGQAGQSSVTLTVGDPDQAVKDDGGSGGGPCFLASLEGSGGAGGVAAVLGAVLALLGALAFRRGGG